MTGQELVNAALTQFLDDRAIPPKTDPTFLLSLGNEAEREACIRSNLINDKRTQYESKGTGAIALVWAAADKSVSRTTGSFITDGIVINARCYSDDTSNPGPLTVSTVTALQITFTEAVVNSTATKTLTARYPICHVPLIEDVYEYAVSKKIIDARTGYLASTGQEIKKTTEGALNEIFPYWRTTSYSVIVGFLFDRGWLRAVPTPAEDDTLYLDVSRYPLVDFTLDTEPEIPPEHHRALVDWMCHLAYLKQDAETQDLSKSSVHEGKFTAYFGVRPTAAVEAANRRVPRNLRVRKSPFGGFNAGSGFFRK